MSRTKKSNDLPPLIVILGPTASGKTGMAIKLAKKYNGEIICADSRTIYKGMDIGTAKPGPRKSTRMNHKCSLINGVPHYMIDMVRPDQEFTVAQFKEQAIKIIKDIQKRGKLPFLVGGTGLYISAIVDNWQMPAVPPNKKLREKLEKQTKRYDSGYLYQKLLKLDPRAKDFIQKENLRRVIRGLEVCLLTKKPFSQLRQKGEPMFKVQQIGIKIPRKQLYKRINQRVDKMIKIGLVGEVKKLSKKYSWHLPAMSGLGYRQIGLYLQNKIGLDEAIELIKKETRHYAKRQMTWFSAPKGRDLASLAGQAGGRRDKRIHWFSPINLKKIQRLIKNFI